MITNFILVAIGGALGAVARYAFTFLPIKNSFPWQTFMVNVIGSFIIGICIFLLKNNKIPPTNYLLLATGICGGFTTFSTFSAEGIVLLQNNKLVLFGLYVIGSVTLALVATYGGMLLAKKMSI